MKLFKTLSIFIILSTIVSCGTPKYVLNDQFKNKKGTNEMAVLVINADNSINAELTQKLATVYKSSKGYNTTTSLLSKQFVDNGLFNKIFTSEKFDFSKEDIKDYADYICLGKFKTSTTIGEVTQDKTMLTANATLEIKIVQTSNGAAINSFTKDAPGVGYSKQQAINTAIENIINSLK